jgi:hypothetical protein
MKKHITRRYFIIKNSRAGFLSVSTILFSGSLMKKIVSVSKDFLQIKNPGIWKVRKEAYAPSPEPRAGISLSMNYTGKGLKREEIRAVIKSSDWAEKPKKRISENH